ncbi:unnamed protein product [Timema podura]|uniref:Ell-associated factor Eaf n=1 Tax=Timema podura TaxID=61482 RepID=A0ABN7NRZ7_TIMPD|nr:unnamed protein product [Timema podura]
MQRPNHSEENLSEKLGLGSRVYEVKLGTSFTGSKGSSFHTIRYDFKPASVDLNKMSTIDTGTNHQMTVTVPHLDGAGTSHTVFKGSQRPYQKECVLIIDKTTGEITLEKLSSNIQVKKTRMENNQKSFPSSSNRQVSAGESPMNNHGFKSAPLPQQAPREKKSASKSYMPLLNSTLGGCIPKHSPLRASPSYPSSSSPIRPQHKSPPGGSLPMLGLDDMPPPAVNFNDDTDTGIIGALSGTSSNSSSDSASSDSEPETNIPLRTNISLPQNGVPPSRLYVPEQILEKDLQLSESGSDSD